MNVNDLKHPEWVIKYIEIMSDYSTNYTTKQMAAKLSMSRQGIYQYLVKHSEINDIIATNLKKQQNTLRIKAMKALYNRLNKSDKALQIALEIAGEYQRSETLNINEHKTREQLLRETKVKIDRILHKE